jgi:hypothetical protein
VVADRSFGPATHREFTRLNEEQTPFVINFDPASGALSIDDRFRHTDSTRPGIGLTGKTRRHAFSGKPVHTAPCLEMSDADADMRARPTSGGSPLWARGRISLPLVACRARIDMFSEALRH